jgi:hypothetical protein
MSKRTRKIEFVLSLLLTACLLRLFARIISWPLIGDASLLHYTVFLISHGMAPYRELQEINMPGAYFVDWAVMRTLGTSAVAWHVFDISLILSTFITTLIIALPYDWFAGLFASSLFGMIHARDGITQSGQRDLTIAVLMLLSYALIFLALRSGRYFPTFCSGVLASFAILVKPVAIPVAIGILAMSLWELRKRHATVKTHLSLWGTGFLIPLGITAAYLVEWHSLSAFFDILLGPVRYHASLGRLDFGTLIARLTSQTLPLILGALVLVPVSLKLFKNWEYSALLVGSLTGAFCYLVQGKGYSYQRYPFEIFTLLLVALVLTNALQKAGWPRAVAALTILYGCFVLAPVSTAKALAYNGTQDDFGQMLRRDLTSLGGPALDRKVQCLDTFAGCLRVLYEMRLVQSTGLMYDEFLFNPDKSGVVTATRERFLTQIRQNPPSVFVVTDQVYPNGHPNLDKTLRWPLLAEELRKNYLVFAEHHPTRTQEWEGKPLLPSAYRIYVHK